MKRLPITPSQTLGPFFAHGLTPHQYGYEFTSLMDGILLAPSEKPDQTIFITGTITDGDGLPVTDAMIEFWQANEHGRYWTEPVVDACDRSVFTGFGRVGTGTGRDHQFNFTTLKPGITATNAAPHIHVLLFMRGSLRMLYCRLYFSDESEANEQDALLSSIDPDRRHTLIAVKQKQGHYLFNIRLQGPDETVFFDL